MAPVAIAYPSFAVMMARRLSGHSDIVLTLPLYFLITVIFIRNPGDNLKDPISQT